MGFRLLPSVADIHPIIRILCLLVVSFFLVSAKPAYLITTLFLVSIAFVSGSRTQLLHCGRILARLKWLFLSIFIIYISLTPGRAVFPTNISLGMPLNYLLTDVITLEGLYLGSLRVCSLVLLILVVNIFIQAERHTELSYALIWLLSPLRHFGFPVDRLAIRMALTFKYVSEFQGRLFNDKQHKKNQPDRMPSRSEKTSLGIQANNIADIANSRAAIHQASEMPKRSLLWRATSARKESFRSAISQAIDKSVILVEKVLSRVDQANVEPVDRPIEIVPRLHQWLLPIALIGVYMSV